MQATNESLLKVPKVCKITNLLVTLTQQKEIASWTKLPTAFIFSEAITKALMKSGEATL